MKFIRLCNQCMNQLSDHPGNCGCFCHMHAALDEIKYSLRRLSRKMIGLRESLEKFELP